MEHDLFTNLPTEIKIDILLILPTRSIMRCKCVCKSWRDFIETPEFVESHFSRSDPCVGLKEPHNYKTDIVRFVDIQSSGQNCYCNTILNFNFPHEATIRSSANGLLFLSSKYGDDLYICNPISHEYIKLPSPVLKRFRDVFGFGASKLSDEYKVVKLFSDGWESWDHPRKCEVYSLRRGSWRSVETAGDQLRHHKLMSGAVFLNGNLHCLVGVHSDFRGILCFDLETECFSTFSLPPDRLPHRHHRRICALGGCLCLYYTSRDGSFVIWLMNKYGDAKSWTKEFVIKLDGLRWYCGDPVPIKVSKDGVFVFVKRTCSALCYYSSKTKTIQAIDGAAEWFVRLGIAPRIYTPSVVSLKTLTMENNVIPF